MSKEVEKIPKVRGTENYTMWSMKARRKETKADVMFLRKAKNGYKQKPFSKPYC